MAPTNRGVDKQPQNRRQTAATPVFNHDGTNIVITPNSNRSSFPSLNIPFTNVPPGVTRHEDIPFTQFTQQQQSFNGMNMGMNQMNMHQQQLQQQHFSGDPLSSSSSVPTPTPTPGPGNGFQGSAFFSNNGNNMLMRPMGSSPNFYNNGHPGSLGMYGNGMQQMQSPDQFSSQQQGQYGMPGMSYNMGFGFPGQQQQPQQFNMQNNMYNMMPFSPSNSAGDFPSYEPPSTSSSETPEHDFVNGDAGMDVELDADSVDMLSGGQYNPLLSPSTEIMTSPSSDRTPGGIESRDMDAVVKGEDFGSGSSLAPPLLVEAKATNGIPNATGKAPNGTGNGTSVSKSSLPSSKEKEQNKQKLYRNRKSEFTNKMRDELLGMGMLPSTRVTHAPEIMSKTADTLRDYRELLELIQNKIEGMPTNIAAVPGAVKKLLNENGNVFNNLRSQPPQLSLAQQPQQQSNQQQQANHTFKPDIKVPLGANTTTTASLPGRVTRSGAHHVF